MNWFQAYLLPLSRSGLCLLLVGLLIPGCATMQPLPNTPEFILQEIKPGDRVRVVSRDGTESEFTVKRVAEASLYGPEEEHPISEIIKIERREEVDTRKPGGACLEAGGIFLLFFAFVVTASVP